MSTVAYLAPRNASQAIAINSEELYEPMGLAGS